MVGLLVILTGCNSEKDPLSKLSKNELIAMINESETDLAKNETRIIELETLLKGIQQQDGPTAAISSFSDGTGRLTFNSIDGKIVFPKPFEYPASTQAPNTSAVNITNIMKVVPTGNWIMKLGGTSLELEHPSGVYGIFQAGNINTLYAREKLQDDVFAKFFSEFPPDTIKYSKLFADNNWVGLQADTETFINEKKSTLRCGMLAVGNTSLTYMFIYSGERDVTKDEVILSLLKTMQLGGQVLRVE